MRKNKRPRRVKKNKLGKLVLTVVKSVSDGTEINKPLNTTET